MKLIIVFVAVLAIALARPQKGQAKAVAKNPNEVTILRYDNDNIGVGGYKYGYELSDGSKHEESAELKNVGTDDEAISVRGSFSYIGADGVTYTVTYIADENGFQPQGAHLPVAP